MDDVMELDATALGEEAEGTEDYAEGEESSEPVEGEESAEPVEGEEPEGEEESEEDDEPEVEQEKPVDKVQDGRNMPDSLKKGIALLKGSNKEAADMVRAQFFQNRDYRDAVGTPQEAVALKAAYEQIGGVEGLAAMEAEREEWNQVDLALGEGKAADLLADKPELLVKNAIPIINAFADKAPEQYAHYTDKLTYTKMGGDSTLRTLNALHGILADNPQAQSAVASLHDHLYDMREKAQEFEQKRVDPREEQLKQRETQFEEQRRADFEGTVYNDAQSFLKPEIDRVISSELNGRKVSDATMEIFREKITAEIEKRLAQVPGFERNLDSHYRTGDRGKSLNYIKSQYQSILGVGKAGDVIKPYLRDINPQKAPAVKTASDKTTAARSQAPADPGKINMNGRWPNHSDVDWGKTTTKDYASGTAVLKSGKIASGYSATA